MARVSVTSARNTQPFRPSRNAGLRPSRLLSREDKPPRGEASTQAFFGIECILDVFLDEVSLASTAAVAPSTDPNALQHGREKVLVKWQNSTVDVDNLDPAALSALKKFRSRERDARSSSSTPRAVNVHAEAEQDLDLDCGYEAGHETDIE
ncbi:hypothetical protein ANO11243_097320 [Dothideomycetidae sp. 11243]|nr:hypothetical protein ANO11243_097320 [fungal sp. No.11243]